MSAWREGWFEGAGGPRLFYRDYPGAPGATPVLCLPGLTRTARDFAPLAEKLAPRRRVICPDMRGRGRSAHDPDPKNYHPAVEAGDALALLDRLGLERAAFVGTSRGGILTMLIAAAAPQRVAAAVLNDIGPRIEAAGLRRIAEGLRAPPAPLAGWDAAAAATRAEQSAQFPRLTDAEWRAFARRLYAEGEAGPARDYDPRLFEGVAAALSEATPELWPQFEALAGRPVLAIRGARSDILSAETLAEMQARLPEMRALTLEERGHCPFLDEPEAVAAIEALLAEADRAG